MALFRRRAEHGTAFDEVPGLAAAVGRRGMRPTGEEPFDVRTEGMIRRVSRTLHGLPARPLRPHMGIAPMFFTDAFRGTIDDGEVTLANVHTPTETMDPSVAAHVHMTSLVAMEIATILPIQGIEPRQRESAFHGPEAPTADSAFDERFRVAPLVGSGSDVLTTEVRRLISTREDRSFACVDTTLLSIAKEPFVTSDDALQAIDEVAAIVRALPASIVPATIDHSVDDLFVRMDNLHSVDEAIVFLGELSDGDRKRLAASPTPLARFAQVRTPDEITTLFLSLPEADRLAILAMFHKATG
jgi:hypothetical protein